MTGSQKTMLLIYGTTTKDIAKSSLHAHFEVLLGTDLKDRNVR